jgi:cell division protein FtsW
VKPALVVLVSWMFSESQKGRGVPGVSIAFFLYALTIGLLLIQPDIGQSLLITVAFGAAFFMAGVPLNWIALLGAGGHRRPGLDLLHVRSRAQPGDALPVT